MTVEAKIAPKNSLLLIMDRDGGEIPISMDGRLVVSTPSCIAVGTLSEADGETSVIMTNEKTLFNADANLRKVFTGVLATPQREVQVCTVLLQPVVKIAVMSLRNKVEIWANSESEPSKLRVIISSI